MKKKIFIGTIIMMLMFTGCASTANNSVMRVQLPEIHTKENKAILQPLLLHDCPDRKLIFFEKQGVEIDYVKSINTNIVNGIENTNIEMDTYADGVGLEVYGCKQNDTIALTLKRSEFIGLKEFEHSVYK